MLNDTKAVPNPATDIHIPPEVAAAARAEFGRSLDWTAALKAGLAAWPEMSINRIGVLLPLPPKESE